MTRARDVANLIGSGNYSSTTFTATAGQTAFTISHTQGFVQVFMNGLLLDETVDYTSNGSAVTLTSGAAAGDEIEVVAYNTFSVGDALNQAAADTRYVNATGDTMSGDLTIDTNTFHVDVADNRVGIGTTSPAQTFHVNGGAANVVAKFESTDAFAAAMFTDNAGNAEIGNNGNDVVLMPSGTERFRVLNDGRFRSGEISFANFQGTIHSSETRWYKLLNYNHGFMMEGTAQLAANRNGGFNQTGAHRNYNFSIGGYNNAIYGPFNGSGDTGESGNGTLHIGSNESIYLRTTPSTYGGTVTGLIIGRLNSWDYDGTYVTSAP